MFQPKKSQLYSTLLALMICTSILSSANAQSQTIEIPIAAASAVPATPNRNSTKENIWKAIVEPTTLPTGWRVRACDGDAPFLCVTKGREAVGTIELLRYPIETLPDFQKMLVTAGIPVGETNYQSPRRKAQIVTALRAWVADYYSLFARNRQPEYGRQVTFSTTRPQEVTVGNLPGIRYGFTGIERGGRIREKRVGYVAFDGKTLYVIATAFDPLSEIGTFKTAETLRLFEPYLSKIVTELRLTIPLPQGI